MLLHGFGFHRQIDGPQSLLTDLQFAPLLSNEIPESDRFRDQSALLTDRQNMFIISICDLFLELPNQSEMTLRNIGGYPPIGRISSKEAIYLFLCQLWDCVFKFLAS